jgi:hypothetical protein
MAMYNFVPPFREVTFCGVPSCVFDKLGCAASEKGLRNTGLDTKFHSHKCNRKKIRYLNHQIFKQEKGR